MKKIWFLLFAAFSVSAGAQTKDDLSTVNGIIGAFYSCLDVQRGDQIDSARFMNLFNSGAQLDGIVPSRKDTSKTVTFRISPEQYLQGMKVFTAAHRFREWEIGRQTLSYGHMTTVYSAYELMDVSEKGDTVKVRGVNTFSLFYDGTRYRITYCNYEEESKQFPIPEGYLRKEKPVNKKR